MRYAYELTEKGKALGDILLAFVRWARNTYRVHGLWRVQRCIPGASENPLGNRIESHSCNRLIQSVGGVLTPFELSRPFDQSAGMKLRSLGDGSHDFDLLIGNWAIAFP